MCQELLIGVLLAAEQRLWSRHEVRLLGGRSSESGLARPTPGRSVRCIKRAERGRGRDHNVSRDPLAIWRAGGLARGARAAGRGDVQRDHPSASDALAGCWVLAEYRSYGCVVVEGALQAGAKVQAANRLGSDTRLLADVVARHKVDSSGAPTGGLRSGSRPVGHCLDLAHRG